MYFFWTFLNFLSIFLFPILKVKALCVTSPSNPPSQVEWRKNGKNMIDHRTEVLPNKGNDGAFNGNVTRSWFEFMVTSSDDGSVITCLVLNPVIVGSVARDDYTLTVLCEFLASLTIRFQSFRSLQYSREPRHTQTPDADEKTFFFSYSVVFSFFLLISHFDCSYFLSQINPNFRWEKRIWSSARVTMG